MALARSVLPTPAGPSTRIGFSIRSARYATVAISGEGKYPTLSRRAAASSTPVKRTWGPGKVGGESIGFAALTVLDAKWGKNARAVRFCRGTAKPSHGES